MHNHVMQYHDTFFSAAFYYTLANISLQHRSSLNVIQLVTLVKSQDVTKYGIDKILEPFMEDVKKLEKVCIYQCVGCTCVICIHTF